MAELPVREMVLYKHGVGFFIREGAVNGTDLLLTFRRDEINDILKSLVIFDKAGGQVRGLSYQTPMDKAARLENSSIKLSERASLRDLVGKLRGRRAELTVETAPGTLITVTGRVIGLDEREATASPFRRESGWTALVMVQTDDGRVVVHLLDAVRTLRILDPLADADLSYFLDTSVSEDARRAVTVRLSEGEHEIVVYYVAPSPTWRVSYRVVAESEARGEGEERQTGKALLQGWGLFDNRLEEDLQDVRVTLVAGQPISFIYDLFASKIPTRPVVQDESRVAPGPIEFAGAAAPLALAEPQEETSPDDGRLGIVPSSKQQAQMLAIRNMSGDSHYARASTPPAPRPSISSASSAALANTSSKDAGEFFQYKIDTPVSVLRGESALVPITSTTLDYSRELLYNGSKLPTHPVAALRFKNTTALTLERGPVTVIEDGDYKGEAVIPFTKDGGEVYLPYAVELGVRIAESMSQKVETARLELKGEYILLMEYHVVSTTYAIENSTNRAVIITIEAGINKELELVDTRPPDAETLTERRWRVSIPANRRTEFVRKERRLIERREDVLSLSADDLKRFFDNRWLDEAALRSLSAVLERWKWAEQTNAEKEQLSHEREQLYKQQEQLRANLGALQATGKEAELRDRILAQFSASQDRLEAINKRDEEIDQQLAAAEKEIEAMLKALA